MIDHCFSRHQFSVFGQALDDVDARTQFSYVSVANDLSVGGIDL